MNPQGNGLRESAKHKTWDKYEVYAAHFPIGTRFTARQAADKLSLPYMAVYRQLVRFEKRELAKRYTSGETIKWKLL